MGTLANRDYPDEIAAYCCISSGPALFVKITAIFMDYLKYINIWKVLPVTT